VPDRVQDLHEPTPDRHARAAERDLTERAGPDVRLPVRDRLATVVACVSCHRFSPPHQSAGSPQEVQERSTVSTRQGRVAAGEGHAANVTQRSPPGEACPRPTDQPLRPKPLVRCPAPVPGGDRHTRVRRLVGNRRRSRPWHAVLDQSMGVARRPGGVGIRAAHGGDDRGAERAANGARPRPSHRIRRLGLSSTSATVTRSTDQP
jgi:hypothetical protein